MDPFERVQAVSVVGVEGKDAKVQLICMLQDHREDEVEDGGVHGEALWPRQQLGYRNFLEQPAAINELQASNQQVLISRLPNIEEYFSDSALEATPLLPR